MIIQQIRNATVKITYTSITFLVDPWFQDKGTGFSAKAIRPEMQGLKNPLNDLPDTPEHIVEGVDFCLVTHVHPDHVTKDHMPDEMRMIAQNESDVEKLRQMGFQNVEWFSGATMTMGQMTIHRVEGIHGDTPEAIKRMGPVSGFVLESGAEVPLYIAGDTIYYEGVRQTIGHFRPGVIIVNCCAATTPIGRLIMGLEDVERVCADAPDALVIASHLDSINHATVSSEDVKRMAAEKGLAQIRVPADGESIAV